MVTEINMTKSWLLFNKNMAKMLNGNKCFFCVSLSGYLTWNIRKRYNQHTKVLKKFHGNQYHDNITHEIQKLFFSCHLFILKGNEGERKNFYTLLPSPKRYNNLGNLILRHQESYVLRFSFPYFIGYSLIFLCCSYNCVISKTWKILSLSIELRTFPWTT